MYIYTYIHTCMQSRTETHTHTHTQLSWRFLLYLLYCYTCAEATAILALLALLLAVLLTVALPLIYLLFTCFTATPVRRASKPMPCRSMLEERKRTNPGKKKPLLNEISPFAATILLRISSKAIARNKANGCKRKEAFCSSLDIHMYINTCKRKERVALAAA